MDYWQVIGQYADRYSYIRYLESISARHWNKSKATVTVLEFFPDHVESKPNLDSLAFSHYLDRLVNNTCQHRLYLIEDLDCDVIGLIGDHFWVDPYVFACQAWTTFWSNFPTFVGAPRRLFSTIRPSGTFLTSNNGRSALQDDGKNPESFTLRYLEINVLKTGSPRPKISMYSNDNFGREMRWDKLDRSDKSFYIRRNSTFWYKKSTTGWDAFILSEPPVSFADARYTYHAYQHGYCDISPWPGHAPTKHNTREPAGPWRRSLRGDLEFYWRNRASPQDIQQAIANPQHCTLFLKKIVASHWNVALEYLWRKVSQCQIGAWGYEERWSEDKKLYHMLRDKIAQTNEWRRRMAWIVDWYNCSLETLGISPTDAQTSISEENNQDFLIIRHRLNYCKQELENGLNAITGISQTLQGTVSVDEATLARRLAYLGLIFIPLAFASSIFSMGGEFQPGEKMFWVYFAVAIPLTLITLFCWWLVKKFYDRTDKRSLDEDGVDGREG